MKIHLFSLLLLLFSIQLMAQSKNELRADPPFWWTNMKEPELQLMLYGDNIASLDLEISYPGISVYAIHKVENPNYLFIDLLISKEAKAGEFQLLLKEKRRIKYSYRYQLKEREYASNKHQGFDASDVLYLIMPDRFANGDPTNDDHPDYLEKSDRNNPDGRHGGDLQGIINRLDYIKNLGFTTIWLNPFQENNMPAYSYHGYAITDFYKTDARLGNNELYKEFVNESHQRGLKIVMDLIFNHAGTHHFFIKDLPMQDWIHQHEGFFRSNYRASAVVDPYVSEYDHHKMLTGWFDKTMADLNQNNNYLKKYLIQNTIWWIEYSGIDGIRVDTQPYPYKEFMAEWSKAIMEAYPTFNIVGEAWLQKIPITAYFQTNSKLSDSYNSFMPVVTDFPMYNAINKAFKENEGWTEGLAQLYYVLAQDFVYSDPNKLLIFCDNHDLNRYYESLGHDFNAYKMGLSFLLTTRGIPQIYYGTEILMDGEEHKGHGYIRKDFPGGWNGDEFDAFNEQNLEGNQKEAFLFMKKLLNWRKNNPVIYKGKLKHFIPENGIYVYFRYNEEKTVMVVMNNKEENQTLDLNRFEEMLKGKKKAKSVLNDEIWQLESTIELKAKSASIFELE